jgi:hypothetical protein
MQHGWPPLIVSLCRRFRTVPAARRRVWSGELLLIAVEALSPPFRRTGCAAKLRIEKLNFDYEPVNGTL